MRTTMIRYRTTAGNGETNQALVREVFAELADRAPAGLTYAAFVGDDGLSFVHLVQAEEDAGDVLPGLASFARFRSTLPDRSAAPPESMGLHRVGSYGGLA